MVAFIFYFLEHVGLCQRQWQLLSFFFLIGKKDVYSKSYFMQEWHKANQKLQMKTKRNESKE